MWMVTGTLLLVWFILKFALHKGGYVHILLVAAISVAVVQFMAYRKTRYHRNPAGR